jgi:integrase
MAVIVKEKVKGSNEWWIFINYKGKRKSKKVGSKKAANVVKREVEASLARGDMGMIKEKPPTLSKYGKEILESPLNGWAEGTSYEYLCTFKLHIEPRFGHRRLDEIKRRHVKKMIEELRKNQLSAPRIETIVQILRNILKHAIEDEFIEVNPCDKMGKYCGEKNKKMNPLDVEQAQQLLEKATHLPIELEALYATMVFTGLRIGEALALEWTDIDFEKRMMKVTKQWDYRRKEIRPPKNDSQRVVRLSPRAAETLKRLEKEKVSVHLVFPNTNGSYLTHAKVVRWLDRIAPKKITSHDLRHTYATLRLNKGDNLVDVSTQLGHKGIDITLKVYTHWIPREEYLQQVDELDNLLLSAPHTHPEQVADSALH